MTRHLLTASTTFEIQPLLERLDMLSLFQGSTGAAFRKGSECVDVLVTGIGQLQAGFHLGQTLASNEYASVLNFGISGSFRDSLGRGSLVRVVQEELADLGAEDNGGVIDLFEMGLLNPDMLPFAGGVIKPAQPDLQCLSTLPEVKSVTVNKVLGMQNSIEAIRQRYDPDVVNMEGAAIFYGCVLANLPCASIRAVSDQVGPRDKSKWDIPGAIKSLCIKANEVLDLLLQAR